MCAAFLQFDRAANTVRAAGEVKLTNGGNILHADSAFYSINNQEGEVRQFSAELFDERLRLRGAFAGVKQRRMSAADVSLTSCKPESEIWRMSARAVEVDLDGETADVTGAWFVFGGVPLMYLPYARFVYDDKKRSGLLRPTAHLASDSGIGLKTPFYFYLAENYDWTLTPHWRSRRGVELKNDFRFLTRRTSGEASVSGVVGKGRGGQKIAYRFDDGPWRFRLRAEKVSDDDYLRDFGVTDADKATRHLPRAASLEYAAGGWLLRASAEEFQTLDNALAFPHQRLPGLVARHAGAGGVYGWENVWRYDRFSHSDAVAPSGGRFFWHGRASRYFAAGKFSVVPDVGFRAVKYRVDNAPDAAFFVPYARLDAQAAWRAASTVRADYRLRAALVASPTRRQENAPLYDTTLKQRTLENLYETNRYAGEDRASDDKFFAYGAEYRRFVGARPVIFAGIGQRYHFRRSRVSLPGETPPHQGFGNVLMRARADWQKWQLNTDAEWDIRNSKTKRFHADLRINFSKYQLLNLAFLSDDEETLSAAIATPLGSRAEIGLSGDYLLEANRYSRSLLVLRLRNECDCWRLSLKFSDSLVERDNNEGEFSIGMEFVGLGSVGGDYENFLDSLRR